MKWKLDKNNAREAWLPGLSFVYLRVRMVRTIKTIKVMSEGKQLHLLFEEINTLSNEYSMELDWEKIMHSSLEEVKNVLAMIKRIYKVR